MKGNYELLTGRCELHLYKTNDFKLHKDIISPFQALQELAKKEINADLQIISSFRSYERQKHIWNMKVSGKREIFDDNEHPIDITVLQPKEIIQKIMRFSALPGASRHHWGTDIDIYDANECKKSDVKLTHNECIKGGVFEKLHCWIDEKISLNQLGGFYRPYAQDLGGVALEKWHISYAPISSLYFNQYDINLLKKSLLVDEILLRESILDNLEFLFKQYIQNISQTTT
ncbi:MAG: M15 family metallopeptidase [Halobacteriovoraceae bacterium]|nr:M15 family metallopeptidase [Halobacteriovoraceae bacterium]